MKKLILFATFISFFSSYAQYKRHAPWMAADSLSKTKDASIFTLTNNFNEYWKNKDYKKKGSGYKPYKRWEYHWKNKTNPQGFLTKKYSDLLLGSSILTYPLAIWK